MGLVLERSGGGEEVERRGEVDVAFELFLREGGGRGGGQRDFGEGGGVGGRGEGYGGGDGGEGEGEEKITIETLRRVAKVLKEDVDEGVLRDMILEANGGAGVRKGVGRGEFEGVMRRCGMLK